MAGLSVEFDFSGFAELEKLMKNDANVTQKVKEVVQENGDELKSRMVRKADFKKGYQTGATKGRITEKVENGGMSVTVGPTTEYAPYLEYGTRFMEAQPFVRPAFEEQRRKFERALDNIIKENT